MLALITEFFLTGVQSPPLPLRSPPWPNPSLPDVSVASWLICLQPLPTLIKPTSCCQTWLPPLPLRPQFKNLRGQ